MERATAAHARKALKRSNTLRADAHAILSPTNVSFTRRLTPPGMADDGEVDSITRTSSTQLRWLQQAERQVASEDAAMKQHLDTTHDGVIDGHRADQSQHGEMHLPVRKVYRRLALEEKYRGAYIYLSLALVLTVRNWYRFDWQFASKTYQFLAQAIDEIDGVNAQDTPYCSRTPEGQWVDNATGLICNLYYPDLSEARDLRDYLTTNMLDLPVSLRSICSECAVAMTMSDLSPKMLNPNDYMCSDYDESRSDRAATGPVREGCRGDVVSQLPIDLAWIANPTSVSVPCCRNQTVIFASLYLTALAEGELVMGHGAGVAARPFSELSQYYDMMKAGATNQVIFDFLQRNVHQSGHFMQILISRNQRVFGMNFGAFWSDPGCYDPNYIGSLKSLVTAGKPLADYSAKATLDDCWADQLITPNLRFWSHRYDEEGVSIDGVLQLIYYVLLVFDMTHTAFAIYSTLPENIKRSAREKLVERLVTPRFILLEVASWVLPTLTDTQESMVQPSYALLVSVAQLFVFARAFAEAEAFEPVEKLVSAIGSAAGEIAGLVTIIVVSCVAFMFIYGQLFGIFHLAAARSGLWVYIHLFLEIFHVGHLPTSRPPVTFSELRRHIWTSRRYSLPVRRCTRSSLSTTHGASPSCTSCATSTSSSSCRRYAISLYLDLPPPSLTFVATSTCSSSCRRSPPISTHLSTSPSFHGLLSPSTFSSSCRRCSLPSSAAPSTQLRRAVRARSAI